MKITRISFYCSRTIQYRQFEPMVINMSATAELNETEDPKVATKNLRQLIREQLDAEVKTRMTERKESFTNPDTLEKNI